MNAAAYIRSAAEVAINLATQRGDALEATMAGNPLLRDEVADECLGVPQAHERYPYDAVLMPQGWEQFITYQDASYFGAWIHREAKLAFCYAEGDRILTHCLDEDAFQAELAQILEFYGPPPGRDIPRIP